MLNVPRPPRIVPAPQIRVPASSSAASGLTVPASGSDCTVVATTATAVRPLGVLGTVTVLRRVGRALAVGGGVIPGGRLSCYSVVSRNITHYTLIFLMILRISRKLNTNTLQTTCNSSGC